MPASTAPPPVLLLKSDHGTLGIARSLGRLGVPVFVLAGPAREPGRSSRYYTQVIPWDIDAEPEEDSIRFLAALPKRLDAGRMVLLPSTDRTAILVARHAELLREHYLLAPQQPALVEQLADKRRLFALLESHGLPAPREIFPASLAEATRGARELRYPLLFKGVDPSRLYLAAGYRLRLVRDEETLDSLYRALPASERANVFLQEYIPGDERWLFNGYFDRDSRCLAAFTGRKLRQFPPEAGATSLGVCERNQTVERLCIEFLQGLGYQGAVDIDLAHDPRDRKYKVLDVNPRIGSTFRLFVDDAGNDVARVLYRDLTGQQVLVGHPQNGRRWWVEDQDLRGAWSSLRADRLTVRGWLRSLKGVRETAWFARDDLRPFLRICRELAFGRGS